MNAWGTPERVLSTDVPNKASNIGRESGSDGAASGHQCRRGEMIDREKRRPSQEDRPLQSTRAGSGYK